MLVESDVNEHPLQPIVVHSVSEQETAKVAASAVSIINRILSRRTILGQTSKEGNVEAVGVRKKSSGRD